MKKYKIIINKNKNYFDVLEDFLNMKYYYNNLLIKEKHKFSISFIYGKKLIDYLTFEEYEKIIFLSI